MKNNTTLLTFPDSCPREIPKRLHKGSTVVVDCSALILHFTYKFQASFEGFVILLTFDNFATVLKVEIGHLP